jgi:C1A family cysteine protease
MASIYTNLVIKHYTKDTGILKDFECKLELTSKGPNLHSILIVGLGYDPEKGDYVILHNSWGTGWGDNGLMKMSLEN